MSLAIKPMPLDKALAVIEGIETMAALDDGAGLPKGTPCLLCKRNHSLASGASFTIRRAPGTEHVVIVCFCQECRSNSALAMEMVACAAEASCGEPSTEEEEEEQ